MKRVSRKELYATKFVLRRSPKQVDIDVPLAPSNYNITCTRTCTVYTLLPQCLVCAPSLFILFKRFHWVLMTTQGLVAPSHLRVQ